MSRPDNLIRAQQALNYAYIWMKKRKFATAQVWACICFENMFPSEVLDVLGTKKMRRFNNPPMVLREMRNKIVHEDFIGKSDLFQFLEAMREGIVDPSPEKATELELLFGDRVNPSKEEVGEFEGFALTDPFDDDVFERKIWSLKYLLDKRLYERYKTEMRTGLVSNWSVESEWIWIPVGLAPMSENIRVTKPVASILLFRDQARVMADITTNALQFREVYYNLILRHDEALVQYFTSILGSGQVMDSFFSSKHYSTLEVDRSVKISDWLNKEQSTINKVTGMIAEMRSEIKRNKDSGFNGSRNNILLFGNIYSFDTVCKEGTAFINTLLRDIEILKPFLELIQKRHSQSSNR